AHPLRPDAPPRRSRRARRDGGGPAPGPDRFHLPGQKGAAAVPPPGIGRHRPGHHPPGRRRPRPQGRDGVAGRSGAGSAGGPPQPAGAGTTPPLGEAPSYFEERAATRFIRADLRFDAWLGWMVPAAAALAVRLTASRTASALVSAPVWTAGTACW